MKRCAEAIFTMHHKSGVAEAIQAHKPLDSNSMFVDTIINEWGREAYARICRIRRKLDLDNEDHQKIERELDNFEQTCLFEGYQEVFGSLVPRSNPVLSHNDTQGLNFLVSLDDPKHVILIDYEYGMWNPMFYDLANYLSEFVCDNATVTYYLDYFPTEAELIAITREYFLLFKQKERGDCPQSEVEGLWSLESDECILAVAQVKQCMVLKNLFSAYWPILMLPEQEETDHQSFYWKMLRMRCLMIKTCS